MKHLIAIVLVVALVADLALFFGVGFGVGALSVVASGPSGAQGSASYTQSNYTSVAAMYFETSIISYSSAGVIPATGYSSSSQSTSFDVTVRVWDPSGDDCGNAGHPVWAPGTGSNWGGLLVSYYEPFTIDVNSGSFASNGNSYTISMNGTSSPIYYCLNQGNGDIVSSNLLNGGSIAFSTSFTLVGLYSDARLTTSFIGTGTYCNGNGGSVPVCNAAWAATGLGGSQSGTGNFYIDASASINTWSGQASITNTNPGAVIFNGGTASFSVTTGYNGPGSCPYTVTMSYPSARGGGTDSAFSATCVPNFELSPYTVSWTIPAGTAVNSTTAGWNNFDAVLSLTGNANYYSVVGYAQASIAISPLYQPATPAVVGVSSGQFASPQAGNTETITVWANASAHSGPVGNIQLIIFYSNVGSAAGALPACGAQWVSGISCPGGITMATTANGNGLRGTYSFTVNPPAGFTGGMWVDAQSENQNAQPSNTTYLWISITPADCKPGAPGCPPGSGTLSLWQIIGPLLLSAALVLGGLLAALFVPGVWTRVLAIVLPVGLVVLLYLFVYGSAFAPGGALFPG